MDSEILSVLIVDDELPIRQELRMFEWEKHGGVLVGEAEDGQEALDFFREYQPDVLITDITMPVMDGFELFKRINREFPQTQVILLTCHSDFHYARQALQLGALDYLVKATLDDQELEGALDKAKKARNREQSLLKYTRETTRWQQTKLLKQMMKSLQEFDLTQLQIPVPSLLTILSVDTGPEDRLFVERQIQASLEKLEQRIEPSFRWIPMRADEYGLFFKQDDHHVIQSSLQNIVTEVNKDLDENLSFVSNEVHIHVRIFGEVQDSKGITNAFKAIGHMRDNRFYDHEYLITESPVRPCTPLSREMATEIEAQMNKVRWNLEALSTFIQNEFCQWAIQHRVVPKDLKKLVAKWQMQWLQEWGVGWSETQDSQAVMQSSRLIDLIDTLVHEVERKRRRGSHIRIEILDAKKVIQERLSEPITLSSIAEKVGLSAPYFSRLFREQVGESFNQYVTRVRMEKAVHLLQTTNMKVYEIADDVGIPSYRYFSVIFRQWTGVTPTEFKKGTMR